jgi:hypothetical protein
MSVTLSNLAVDPVSGKFIVIRSSNDEMHEYDMIAERWRNLNMKSPFTVVDRHCVVSAPISTYGVIIYLSEWGNNSTVWLYKHTSAPAIQVGSRPMEHPAIRVSPNPFNAAIKIAVSGQRIADSKIGIALYDIEGKMIQRLSATSYQLSAGITWSPASLPAGVYMVKAEMKGRSLSRRIILQK